MTHAILRGFDFPAIDAGEQFRFCNPLVSFEESESASIYFVRDLDWTSGRDDRAHWFTPLDTDEIETFATLVPRTMLQIRPGNGIVLIGERIIAAAQSLEIALETDADDAERILFKEFTGHSGTRYRIGVADTDSYRKLAKRLTDKAASIFDDELQATAAAQLSERAETALFLLRKCGFSLPTVTAIRQLAAARVTRHWDRHRRLLIRFSRELKATEGDLDDRVDRHLRHIKDAGASPSRPTAPELPGKFLLEELVGIYVTSEKNRPANSPHRELLRTTRTPAEKGTMDRRRPRTMLLDRMKNPVAPAQSSGLDLLDTSYGIRFLGRVAKMDFPNSEIPFAKNMYFKDQNTQYFEHHAMHIEKHNSGQIVSQGAPSPSAGGHMKWMP